LIPPDVAQFADNSSEQLKTNIGMPGFTGLGDGLNDALTPRQIFKE
jgi:hypothetical protein